jgi:hypothetical protein
LFQDLPHQLDAMAEPAITTGFTPGFFFLSFSKPFSAFARFSPTLT